MKGEEQKYRARKMLSVLKKYYKHTGPFANWSTPLELVVATMLSAQCTDERVNRVTPPLFKKYREAKDYARAQREDLERMVYSTGYYKSKARYLKGMGQLLEEEYDGEVPVAFEDLIRIPGISKKSACIIGAKAFGKYYGVAVDTHVFRVAFRIGWSRSKTREKMALDIEKLFPPREFLCANEYLIMLGRDVCVPHTPHCSQCVLEKFCPRRGVSRKR